MIRTVSKSCSAQTSSGCPLSVGLEAKATAPGCWGPALSHMRTTKFPRRLTMTRSASHSTFALILIGIFAISAPTGWAQVSAAISGKVEDATGASVRGANITVKSLETGATRVVTTDDQGDFRALSLPLGPQEVTVEKAGFKEVIRTGINLALGQDAVLN